MLKRLPSVALLALVVFNSLVWGIAFEERNRHGDIFGGTLCGVTFIFAHVLLAVSLGYAYRRSSARELRRWNVLVPSFAGLSLANMYFSGWYTGQGNLSMM